MSMVIRVIGFNELQKDYTSCKNFSVIYVELSMGQWAGYSEFLSAMVGYLFKGTHLCLPNTSHGGQVI